MKKVGTRPTAPGGQQERPLVLYVEDNDDNWFVAETRLGKSYRMVRARTDREACDALRRHHHELYVVLMDIELNGSQLDGIALTRLARGLLEDNDKPPYARNVPVIDAPIIYVTAYYQGLTGPLAGTGADLVMPKPVEFMQLIRRLTSLHLSNIGVK